jgi:hypothetical protein
LAALNADGIGNVAPRQDSGKSALGAAGKRQAVRSHGVTSTNDSKNPYSYESLERASEIRLLRLPNPSAKPVNQQDLPDFTLDHVLLNSRPKYYSVSYTWGSQTPSVDIILNQKFSLKITKNLWTAILMFGRYYPGDYLRIDQICINQASQGVKREKSAQVNMMTRIYAQSECTLVWLGQEEENTRAVSSFSKLCC